MSLSISSNSVSSDKLDFSRTSIFNLRSSSSRLRTLTSRLFGSISLLCRPGDVTSFPWLSSAGDLDLGDFGDLSP